MKYKGIVREVKLLARGLDKYIYLKTELDYDSDMNYLRDLVGKYIIQDVKEHE